jgi:hypothetical protein
VKTYLVFEPAEGGRDALAADEVVFLREKFRWLALLFGPLWLLWNRLWLAFFVWLGAVVALAIASYAAGLNEEAAAVVMWLPTLLIAFEGTELLRRKLLRRRYREAVVTVAADLEDAERRYFAEWEGRTPAIATKPPVASTATSPASSPPVMSASISNSVIGLFPEPGGRR